MVDIYSIVLSSSVGFIAGYATGYAVKKALKAMMTILGGVLAILLYLDYLQVITINWARLQLLLSEAIGAIQSGLTGIQAVALSAPIVGFAAGFIVGLQQG